VTVETDRIMAGGRLDPAERAELASAAAEVLRRHCPMEATKGRTPQSPLDRRAWSAVCGALDPAGLRLPEQWGGQGLTLQHAAVIAAAAGAVTAPLPLLGTAGIAVPLIAALASPAQRDELLPDLLDGSRVATVDLAVRPDDGDRRHGAGPIEAVAERDRVRVTGVVGAAAWGADAEILVALVPHRDAGQEVVVVELTGAGVDVERLDVVDRSRPRSRVRLDGATGQVLGGSEPASQGAVIARVIDEAVVLAAVEAVGAARAFLDETVRYVSVREQFGHPVGSFQAVQHRAADLHGEVESARASADWALDVAVRTSRAPTAELSRAASVALLRSGAALEAVSRQGLHLHGGIGFTWEHLSHLYLKRALGDQSLLGGRSYHLRRLADALGAQFV